MPTKNILCAYSGEAAHGSGLRHAIKLAKHHDAWLTGVLRHGRPVVAKRFPGQIPQELLEFMDQKDAEMIKEVSDRFTASAQEAGLGDQSEFVDLEPEDGIGLSEFARSFDMIITGHHGPDIGDIHLTADPDQLALNSGRPVLVVPDDYDADSLAERALVAWDGKRASARAIGDAMDILAEKAEVTLLSIGEAPVGTERMVANLKRHGVAVAHETRQRSGSLADTILAAAAVHDARLIVCGAYEHSKFAHDLWGGVTTDIQSKARVPVFLSH